MAEKFIAHWFPKKHNVVIATFASYVAIYGLIKIAGGNPQPEKKVKEVVVVRTTPEKQSASGYQAPTADNIGKWLDNADNMKQWEKSL